MSFDVLPYGVDVGHAAIAVGAAHEVGEVLAAHRCRHPGLGVVEYGILGEHVRPVRQYIEVLVVGLMHVLTETVARDHVLDLETIQEVADV
ncbi:hypothetical protein MJQ72_26560 [Amycolatopsis sp. EV170708-02-1]|nr:hypothetical protein [Amycolatopsis sp. EV170708-02-1]UMP00063.1 hypothetical protein MJQ72_26560 [Amycolatopsis sp. EV170708-02-1]